MELAIKNIEIVTTTRYPIVSAYEFDLLMDEGKIKTLLNQCSIYFILQRPLLLIQNLRISKLIEFNISDGTEKSHLKCAIDPSQMQLHAQANDVEVEVMFYKKEHNLTPPFNDVAGIKLINGDGTFLTWLSPAKFVYAVLDREPGIFLADGDYRDYIDYYVHYIGKSFSQKIWNRIRKHEKMQKILTKENALNNNGIAPANEIALLMLDIVGFREIPIFGAFEQLLRDGIKPITHPVGTPADNAKFDADWISADSPKLTTEVEALLVNAFKPRYNKVLFENYPYIESGTRSAGYTDSVLEMKKMPVTLKTEACTHGVD
ncbi:MAG TPA: hypothetical protein VHC91_20450 [Trinickia sp.]|uniref:hypothetical protein n=1 Tax=Trinickia sp. TaxID=2571163 RepID=UPI002BED5A46|nr:hypothetical protein [Trinickia sp.]HVW52731.1 hypothetical protein [Trinickia sp.]